MRIQCKECGVFFTVDQQDAAEHIGICDRCLNKLPAKASYQANQFGLVETKKQKAARQKAELEAAKLTEEKLAEETSLAEEAKLAEQVKTSDTPVNEVSPESLEVKTGEGDPVETVSEGGSASTEEFKENLESPSVE